MAASLKPFETKFQTSHVSFREQVGMIANYYELEWHGFRGQDFAGAFGSRDVAHLLEHCGKNPEFHIITCIGPGRYVNRYEPGHRVYCVGNGDKDPGLQLNHLLDPDWIWINGADLTTTVALTQDLPACGKKKPPIRGG